MIKNLLVLFTLLEASSLVANAAAPPLPSNFVQNVTLLLSVVEPGKVSSNGLMSTVNTATITTRQAIEAFGAATSNNFSTAAKLEAVAPIGWFTNPVVTVSGGRSATNNYVYGYPGEPVFQIRDGMHIVDVNQYFTVTTVNSNTYIGSYVANHTGGYVSYTGYRVRMISVSNAALAFTGQGFVQTPLVNVPIRPRVVVVGYDDNWTSLTGVADNGIVNGVLRGTISATYERLE